MFEIVLRWAWGTLLTAIVTAILTMLLRHGRRWFRPVRRFIRTGRWQTTGRGMRRDHAAAARPNQVAKEPKMTAARVLTLLAQLAGRKAPPPASPHPINDESERLDMKF